MNGNAQKLIKYMDGASKRFIKEPLEQYFNISL